MYGIINKAIEGLVKDNFGNERWEEIKAHSKVSEERFLSNEQYDDSITYDLASSAAEVLQMSLRDILIAFGKYWVVKTAHKHYGSLMNTGEHSLSDFIINLPNFHSRVMLIYPNIKPPEFKVTDVKENSLCLHYFSSRPGLTDFVEGLLLGLGEVYKTTINVKTILNRSTGHDHDEFNVTW